MRDGYVEDGYTYSVTKAEAEELYDRGNYKTAVGLFKRCKTMVEHTDSSNSQLLDYFKMKISDCEKKI